MSATEIIFLSCLFIVFYAYLGYGLLLFGIILLKRQLKGKPVAPEPPDEDLPEVTLVVAAYNEEAYMEEKIKNTFALLYPKDKLHLFFVTDGSSDSTPEIIRRHPEITLFHQPERHGKIAAVNRVMPQVKTPVTIFTDANTKLNPEAIYLMARHFLNEKVGAVAGEKRIETGDQADAAGAGEGIYWKYESQLKKWDSELYSVVGAAGELFAVRTALYQQVPSDMVIEDFYMTLKIAMEGYRVIYEPEASASEKPSASVGEELKRKIRIAAGGIQAIVRLAPLLNFFRYGVLSFAYISHRVLRWTLAPLALPVILLTNLALAIGGSQFYQAIFSLQILFYLFAMIGYWLETQQMKVKAFFIPYYFFIMNYAVYRGFFRYLGGKQSVLWEKARRQ